MGVSPMPRCLDTGETPVLQGNVSNLSPASRMYEPLTPTPRWSDWVLEQFDRHRRVALVALLLIFLAGFNGQWRPEPDSALYLSLGRNLAEGRGYTYHGEPHHLAYPGWPWMLSGIFRAFGGHAMFFAHLAIVLMGLASLALMYRLMLLHAGRAMAVMMTVGLGISHTFYRYCFELRSDMPFMLGVMAVLAGYEGVLGGPREGASDRRRSIGDWILLGAGLALAVVTRPTMWTLLLALLGAVVFAIARGRVSKKMLIVLAIVPLFAAAFLFADPRRQGAGHTMGDYEDVLLESISWQNVGRNIHVLLDPMASEALFGIDFGKALHVGPISLQGVGSVVAIAAGLLVFRERALWGFLFLLTIGMMLIVLARDRYFLPVLPMMIYGWWLLIRRVNLRLPGRWGNVIFAILFALGAVPNFAKVGELVIEQRHPNVLTAIRAGRYESIHRVADMIEANVPPGDGVIAPKKFGRILSFLTRRKVVEAAELGYEYRLNGDWFYLDPANLGADPSEPRVVFPVSPAVGAVKGPFDKEAWSLHPLTPPGGPR